MASRISALLREFFICKRLKWRNTILNYILLWEASGTYESLFMLIKRRGYKYKTCVRKFFNLILLDRFIANCISCCLLISPCRDFKLCIKIYILLQISINRRYVLLKHWCDNKHLMYIIKIYIVRCTSVTIIKCFIYWYEILSHPLLW